MESKYTIREERAVSSKTKAHRYPHLGNHALIGAAGKRHTDVAKDDT